MGQTLATTLLRILALLELVYVMKPEEIDHDANCDASHPVDDDTSKPNGHKGTTWRMHIKSWAQ